MPDNKNKTRTVLIALALALFLGACGDPATSASGTVKDAEGSPVAGVKIVMESEVQGGFKKESEQTTGPDGAFNFVTITGSAENVRLSFTKDGFKEVQKEIEHGKESKVDVVLERE